MPQSSQGVRNGMKESSSKPLKILMLHGYTQSGKLFHAKTRVIEKFLQKVFPGGVHLSYPTGPLRLRPSDVPGFDPSALQGSDVDDDASEMFAWWRRSDTEKVPEYLGLQDGLSEVANTLDREGPFDGVMGFSQGAAMAAIVTSLLDGDARKAALKKAQEVSEYAIPFPEAFEKLNHPSLKFAVCYAGFIAPGPRYKALYSSPPIQTPMLHVVGGMDSVVEEARTDMLIDAAGGREKTQVVVHPGGHFVPSSKQYLEVVAAFIKNTIEPKIEKPGEEDVEDMDVPF